MERASEKPGSGDRFLANLAYLVPGYQGYLHQESRQSEDARLRHRVLGRIAELIDILNDRVRIMRDCTLDRGADQLMQRVERLERLEKAVRYAPYGFVGFFDAPEVTETFLESLLELDLLLFQDLDEVIERTRGASFPPATRSGFEQFFADVDAGIVRIETRLVRRDKLLGNC